MLCIFFMMCVHVNPGIDNASVVSTGEFAWIGRSMGDFLGRASVAALSLISGYLLMRTTADVPLMVIARRRFRTLIVPMLTWNLIFCALLLAKVLAFGVASDNVLVDGETGLFANLTGLTGPTANLALFFLRDLFVSALIVRLTAPWLVRWPVAAMALIGAVTLFDLAEPLVFRPSILFFVAAGAIYASRAPSLAAPLTRRRVILTVLALLGAMSLLALLPLEHEGSVREAHDLLRRCLLVVFMLVAGATLALTRIGAWILPFERRIFETYLLHVPLMSVLWVPWALLVGQADEPQYVLFFLAAPPVALVCGLAFGSFCDRLPRSVQMLLRGKAQAPSRPETSTWKGAPSNVVGR